MCEAARSISAASKEVSPPPVTAPASGRWTKGPGLPQEEEAQKELAVLCPALGL